MLARRVLTLPTHTPTHPRTKPGLAQIVARPTFNQSLKGILSAGPIKSLRYVGPKLRKKWLAASTSSSSASAPTKPKAIAAAAAASSSSEGEKQQ